MDPLYFSSPNNFLYCVKIQKVTWAGSRNICKSSLCCVKIFQKLNAWGWTYKMTLPMGQQLWLDKYVSSQIASRKYFQTTHLNNDNFPEKRSTGSPHLMLILCSRQFAQGICKYLIYGRVFHEYLQVNLDQVFLNVVINHIWKLIWCDYNAY